MDSNRSPASEKCARCGNPKVTHTVLLSNGPGAVYRPSCAACAGPDIIWRRWILNEATERASGKILFHRG